MTETWGNGVAGLTEPNCSKKNDYNTVCNLEMTFPNGISYRYTHDHSKVGIS